MANQTKKARLDGNGVSKPDDTTDVLSQIEQVQTEIDELCEKASDEILAVERRFIKLRQPHYERRAELAAKVPGFWPTILINHGRLAELISEQDEEALQSLTRIEVHEFDDIKSGYKIDFHFSENPFFSNKCLTKEFHLIETGELSSKSTEISWKSGKRLVPPSSSTVKPTSKRAHEPESFFRWFVDGNGNDFGGDEIGEIIKDDVWPNPLQFYLPEDENGDYGDESLDNTAGLEGEVDESFDGEEDEEEEDEEAVDDAEGDEEEDADDN
jgi:template-activating factor I